MGLLSALLEAETARKGHTQMKSWRRSVVALLLGALAAGGYFYAESVRQKNRADLAQVRAERIPRLSALWLIADS